MGGGGRGGAVATAGMRGSEAGTTQHLYTPFMHICILSIACYSYAAVNHIIRMQQRPLKTPDEGRVDDIDKPPPLAPLHRSSPLPSAASTRGHFPPPQASHSALRRLPDHTHQNSWRSRLRMEGGGRIRRWRRRILGRR